MSIREIEEYSSSVTVVNNEGRRCNFTRSGNTVYDFGATDNIRQELKDRGYELVTEETEDRQYPEEVEISYNEDTSAFKHKLREELGLERGDLYGPVFEKLFEAQQINLSFEIDDNRNVRITRVNDTPLEDPVELDFE